MLRNMELPSLIRHRREDVNLDMTLKRTRAQEKEVAWTPSEEP